VGFPGGIEPVVGLPNNYQTANLKNAVEDLNSNYHFVKKILAVRRDFQVTDQTKIKVNEKLYGHVVGYALLKQSSENSQECLIVLANLSSESSYDLTLDRTDFGCDGSKWRTLTEENIEISKKSSQKIKLNIAPYGKVAFLL
jgi:glycosidase